MISKEQFNNALNIVNQYLNENEEKKFNLRLCIKGSIIQYQKPTNKTFIQYKNYEVREVDNNKRWKEIQIISEKGSQRISSRGKMILEYPTWKIIKI